MAKDALMAEQAPTPPKGPEPPPEIRAGKKQSLESAPDFEDEPDFHEAFGDPNKMTLTMRVSFTLLLLGVAGMVAYLALVILYPDQFASRQWIGATADKRMDKVAGVQALTRGFELGGIHLGIPPSEARRRYPSLRLEPDPGGGQKGFFLHHDGEYQVSFKGLEQGERAYRIQSRHEFAKISYLELLAELSGRYGQPAGSGCRAAEKAVAMQCNLFWKMEGVRLTAEIKTSVSESGDGARTLLTVIATDVRPGRLFQGLGKKKRKLKDLNFQK